jgi:hypothetical protein
VPICRRRCLSITKGLGENENWLSDIADEMDIEDGVIWVYVVGDDGVVAFTDFGIENLIRLIKIHKDDPTRSPGRRSNPSSTVGAGRGGISH